MQLFDTIVYYLNEEKYILSLDKSLEAKSFARTHLPLNHILVPHLFLLSAKVKLTIRSHLRDATDNILHDYKVAIKLLDDEKTCKELLTLFNETFVDLVVEGCQFVASAYRDMQDYKSAICIIQVGLSVLQLKPSHKYDMIVVVYYRLMIECYTMIEYFTEVVKCRIELYNFHKELYGSNSIATIECMYNIR